ncbi:MAG: DUF134 domain-containing protein [Nanohaloarchaea archaeon]|nr:DUF134 domain-containing protein [Candidatus Nanohaloarchaea archaeon]
MVRPRKIRSVDFEPEVTYFKPQAVPLSQIEEVELTFDELETLRLSHLKRLGQTDAATMMGVHQSTFQRTLARAREKITDALVNGKAIKIQGGDYKMPNRDGTGPMGQGVGLGQGRGRGRMNDSFSTGLGSICRCPKCGYEQPHIRGQPCNRIRCPECNGLMTRKE